MSDRSTSTKTVVEPLPKAGRRKKVPASALGNNENLAPHNASDKTELQFGAANSTADRAIDILLLFTDDNPTWSATDVAAHLGMPRSTTYRYLNSLRTYALIVEDGQNGFRLGPRLFPLARVAKAHMSVVQIASAHLKALSEKFGELVVLQQRIDCDIFPLDRVATQQRVSLLSTRSHMLPWPATGSAKVLLAFAPPAESERIMQLLQPTIYTPKTIRTKVALRRALDEIRRVGYAVTDEERDEGVWGVAAPIFEKNEAPYCIAIATPAFRITPAKEAVIIRAIKEAAADITRDISEVDF